MNNEQKAVILDYAKELQVNDEPWREFECYNTSCQKIQWDMCTEYMNPLVASKANHLQFRRRPNTITVTIPMPENVYGDEGSSPCLEIEFLKWEDHAAALKAIREEMGEGE